MKNQYLQILRKACQEIHLDYFPQVEASELLYRVITLEDIYLPLNLGDTLAAPGTTDLDELIRRIDIKIAELEAREKEMARLLLEGKEIPAEEPAGDIDSGLRLLLSGFPGGGKSTFCKRLTLALLNNDSAFFEKYSKENSLHFHRQSTPVLIDCKNAAELSLETIGRCSFPELVYKLSQLGLGASMGSLSEKAFSRLFLELAESGLTLIVDGWDEILDKDTEHLLRQKLDQFLCAYPLVDLVLTIRVSYPDPPFTQSYTNRYCIQPLSPRDIRAFCQKWCEVILGADSQRQADPDRIADQILHSGNPQILSMGQNPLDLSLLLTVSKNDGRLPDNKAELFKEVIDLYIFWSTHKNTGALSSKTLRVFLSYIACYFTKHQKLSCKHEELVSIVKQCIIDLEWCFQEDVAAMDVEEIIKELSHTGILTSTIAGALYSFSETRRGTHRQNQEYLTANAIMLGYADEEYNSQAPVDIFENKYNIRQWREVILFMTLMNNGRVRQQIIRRLLEKAQNPEEDTYHYTNLLFDAVVNGADIRLADKHKIYDIVFAEHITDQQISSIHLLMQNETSKTAQDFADYISRGHADSVNRGDKKAAFRYARAILEATHALKSGISPFLRAKELLSPENSPVDIAVGSSVILILAWCKYSDISNAFKPYYTQHRMSLEQMQTIRQLLSDNVCKTQLLNCVRESVLAGFAWHSDFFDAEDIHMYCEEISTAEDPENAELVLSMAPVLDLLFQPSKTVASPVKEKYLTRYAEETARKEYDKIIFTFSICAAIGCWEDAALEEAWSATEKQYSDKKANGFTMGKTRFMQLKLEKENADALRWLQEQDPNADLSLPASDAFPGNPGDRWVLQEQTEDRFTYIKGREKLIVYYHPEQLTKDGADFLNGPIPEDHVGKNNLAYLLRRHEVGPVLHIATKQKRFLCAEELLLEGTLMKKPVSLINMALTRSGVYKNTLGEYEKTQDRAGEDGKNLDMGFVYLLARYSYTYDAEYDPDWDRAILWWCNLACNQKELEGVVVMNWLFELKIFLPEKFNSEELGALLSLARQADMEMFQEFINALERTLALKQA